MRTATTKETQAAKEPVAATAASTRELTGLEIELLSQLHTVARWESGQTNRVADCLRTSNKKGLEAIVAELASQRGIGGEEPLAESSVAAIGVLTALAALIK